MIAAAGLLVFGFGYVAGIREGGVRPRGAGAEPPSTEATMPDLRGLFVDDAMEALADAGIDGSLVRVVERPAAGDPDRVVDQAPRQGRHPDGSITLTRATAAPVPDVAGLAREAAEQKFAAIGAAVDTTFVFRRDAEPGTVVAVDPPAGAPAPERVVVTIGAPPSSVYLDALEPVGTRSCERAEPAEAEGREHAFVCEPYGSQPASIELALDGKADTLTLLAGVPAGDGDEVVQFDALADGAVRATQSLRRSQSAPVTVGVADVRTLVLRVSLVSGTGTSSARAYLADARLSGGGPQLAALPTRS